MTRRRLIGVVGLAAFVLSIAFLARQLGGLSAEAIEQGLTVGQLGAFVLALAMYLTGLSLVHSVWAVMVVGDTRRDGRAVLVQAWGVSAKAQIAKYLPGNVFHLAGRQVLAARYGWRQSVVGGASLFEVVVLPIVALLVVTVAMLLGWIEIGWFGGTVLSSPIVLIAIVLTSGAGIAVLGRWHRTQQIRRAVMIRRRFLLPSATAYLLFFLMAGLGQAVLLPEERLGLVVLASVFAWTVGYLSPGVPAGIGVREAVFVAVLGASDASLAIGVIGFRLVMVLSDLVLYFVGVAITRRVIGDDAARLSAR